jgi:mono/diheme cytochrome c family protein
LSPAARQARLASTRGIALEEGKAMKNLMWAGLLMLGAALVPGLRSGRSPDGQERVEFGRQTYSVYCASCHGRAGRGDGPVAADLKVEPTDLTRLAARNDGRFPRDRTYQAIDGRLTVRGHGTSEMPVWGATLRIPGSERDQEREVRERILDLLSYLESIQR